MAFASKRDEKGCYGRSAKIAARKSLLFGFVLGASLLLTIPPQTQGQQELLSAAASRESLEETAAKAQTSDSTTDDSSPRLLEQEQRMTSSDQQDKNATLVNKTGEEPWVPPKGKGKEHGIDFLIEERLLNETGAKLYPRLVSTSWEEVDDHQTGVNESLTKSVKQFLPGYPIPFTPPSKQPTVICLVHNAASARWKRLFFSSVNSATDEVFKGSVHRSEAPWLPRSLSELRAQVLNSNATRMVFVRNPYTRLLKGFLARAARPPSKLWAKVVRRHGGPYRASPQEFTRFIRNLLAMRGNGRRINKQFAPVTEQCGIGLGMEYDLHLRLEQMEDWYPDLVQLMGLEDFVRRGWSSAPSNEQPQDDDESPPRDCFHALEGMDCEETDVFLQMHGLGIDRSRHQVKPEPMEKALWARAPSLRQDSVFHRFYSTQHTADLATAFLGGDLETFGYEELNLFPEAEELPAPEPMGAGAENQNAELS